MEGIYHMQLFCSDYGNGRIVNWNGEQITVRFEQKEVVFWFPIAFYGVLSATNEEDERKIKELIRRWTIVNPPEKVRFPNAQLTHYIKIYRTALEESGLPIRKNYKMAKEEPERAISEIAEIHKTVEEAPQRTVSETKKKVAPKPSEFTAGAFEYFGVNFLTAFVSGLTLGIAFPFMTAWRLRWMAEHTVYSGKQTVFDGTGTQLFGNYFKWWILSVITLGIYGALCLPLNMNRWVAKHTHFKGESGESYFDGHIWQLFGVNFVCSLVTFLTLGIGSFWAHCYRERWYCSHTFIDGANLRFEGTGMAYFLQRIKWLLLTLVTFGIYGFWLAVRSQQWTVSCTKAV